MADSSEIHSKPDAELQRSKRDQQDSSFLETLVPIPDFFFNIKAEIEPIGGSKWRIRIFGYILYFITLCVMFGSFAYYSLPAQRVSLESIVTSEWQKPGFACKPLQKTTLHGLSTDWSFDECMSAVASPDAENVVSVQKSDRSTHFDYKFASDGVVSFYDSRYASSKVRTSDSKNDWILEGHSCHPEPPYANYFNTAMNYSECLGALSAPSGDSVSLATSYQAYSYFPLGPSLPCYPEKVTWMGNVRVRLNAIHSASGWYRNYGSTSNTGDCLIANTNTQTSAIEIWSTIVSSPADQDGDFYGDYICGTLKQNGNGFRCFDKPKPPATKELAIQRYTAEYPPETTCAPLKLNSPFQCTRNVEVPATTRLSLSVAAAQAVFALLGIALVALLRKLQKPSTTTSESLSTDDDLRSVVRKLRNEFRTTVDKLRTGQDTHEELIQKLLNKEGAR